MAKNSNGGWYVVFFNKSSGIITGQLRYNTKPEANITAKHARATRKILGAKGILIRVIKGKPGVRKK